MTKLALAIAELPSRPRRFVMGGRIQVLLSELRRAGRHRDVWRTLLDQATSRPRIEQAALVVVVIALSLLIVTSCPANRDGMPGRLAAAMDETVAAARSGALALQLWSQDRSTRQLVNVQLTDARDEVTKAYQGIAELRAEDPVDVRRQAMLTASMTTFIGDRNAASAAVRGLPDQPDLQVLHRRLLDGADTLERDYR